ncbi:MAG: Gfo/Idh/MocA family oxidoreductase [Chloroflexi bacterium]|nr:Gfo/Idh/MocA family oxidoreductase [Chloroflexota bacterium]
MRTAAESDRVVMIAHVLRFWPEYVALKDIIDSGELGAPIYVNAVRRQPAPDWTDGGPRGHLSGGSLHDMLIHDFDAANWVLGSPETAFATGRYNPANEAVDQAQVLVTYADGAAASIDGGSMMPESYPFTSRFEVLCEHGAVEYHFRAGGRSFEVGEPTNELTVYRDEGDPTLVSVEQTDPYVNECAYFIDCVRNGNAPERSSPTAALEAMRLSVAAQASADSGAPHIVADV